ncbi:MAG: hypothetical protein RIS21_304 [Planctomycetota bacterium]
MAKDWMPVARRYADALFTLAREEGRIDAVAAELASVKEALAADSDLCARLSDVRTRPASKVAELTKKFPAPSPVVNTLRLMALRGRCGAYADLFTAFAEALDRHYGIVRIGVESATELPPAELAALRDGLKASLGGEVVLETSVNPAILGGLRLKFGSTFVDGSTASRLERLKSSILARS